MRNINSRNKIIERNRIFFSKYLNMTENEFFNRLSLAGPPKGFATKVWSTKNPTAGRCGSVINALRLSSKLPIGFIACGQNEKSGGSHYYLINPITNEVIDPTVYQMDKPYTYEKFHTKFLPQLSENVKKTLKALDLEIDKSKFTVTKSKSGTDIIRRVKGK